MSNSMNNIHHVNGMAITGGKIGSIDNTVVTGGCDWQAMEDELRSAVEAIKQAGDGVSNEGGIHHVNGVVVTGGEIETLTNRVEPRGPSADEAKIRSAVEVLSAEERRELLSECGKLEIAIRERDESKLKKCAKALGKFGIGVLSGVASGVLSGVLLKLLGG